MSWFSGDDTVADFSIDTITGIETIAFTGITADSTVVLIKDNLGPDVERVSVSPHDGSSISIELLLFESALDLSGITFVGFDQPGDRFIVRPIGDSARSIAATSIDDRIATFSGADTIRAGDGADLIRTQGGDDVIYAGISSGDQNEFDVIYGGVGSDQYFATDAAGTNALFFDEGAGQDEVDTVDLSGSTGGGYAGRRHRSGFSHRSAR